MEGLSPDVKPRLEVNDKRVLFQSLLAMTERLFYLNKFPVDMVDFALSVLRPDEEAAIRLLTERSKQTLSWHTQFDFTVHDVEFYLHEYPQEGQRGYRHRYASSIFPSIDNQYGDITIGADNRFAGKVLKWAQKQIRLEDQLHRTAKVLKAIVHSCNTVGQYKRVSPELVTFLPEKYRLALADYTKTSPYPAITVEPAEIDAAISTLAFAALQGSHRAEDSFQRNPKWSRSSYSLDDFPRTRAYTAKEVRQLKL